VQDGSSWPGAADRVAAVFERENTRPCLRLQLHTTRLACETHGSWHAKHGASPHRGQCGRRRGDGCRWRRGETSDRRRNGALVLAQMKARRELRHPRFHGTQNMRHVLLTPCDTTARETCALRLAPARGGCCRRARGRCRGRSCSCRVAEAGADTADGDGERLPCGSGNLGLNVRSRGMLAGADSTSRARSRACGSTRSTPSGRWRRSSSKGTARRHTHIAASKTQEAGVADACARLAQ
jgi:hypothetical protein